MTLEKEAGVHGEEFGFYTTWLKTVLEVSNRSVTWSDLRFRKIATAAGEALWIGRTRLGAG